MALDTFNPYLFVSAGEQSNKFLTPTTAGGIARFQAQRAQSIEELTVQFGPIQEGTGDPAPDNVRPISGRTGLTVTACGLNTYPILVGDDTWVNNNGGTHSASDGELVVVCTSQTASGVYGNGTQRSLLYNQSVAKTVSFDVKAATAGTIAVLGNVIDVTTSYQRKSVTVPAGTTTSLSFYGRGTENTIYIKNMAITENGSTEWSPYVGQTYPISWQTQAGTVYGGTLDVVSGVLTVTHALWTDNGTAPWTRTGSGQFYSWQSFVSSALYTEDGCACNYAKYKNNSVGVTAFIRTSNSTVTLGDGWGDVYATVDDLKAAFAQTPFQIVYKLATPQTYQLTPTDVKTLAGFNQIYSDVGPVIDIKF